ncbi:ABC transporter permease subunit [Ideonella azotifigens]|uniref:ABC transporter permease n=2 Tax=Ideonella azotifigens TaxID=513160 RepID=A0ABN1KFZ3_9BURK
MPAPASAAKPGQAPWRWLLIAPALAFVVLAFLLPVLLLLLASFRVEGAGSGAGSWGLAHFTEFFASALNWQILWRTLRIAGLVTLLSALICYPPAQAIVRVSGRYRSLLMALTILPLMIAPVPRTYAWIVLLGRNGFVNDVIVWLGLSAEPLRLLFTEGAVFIGLLQLFAPLMLISQVSAMENMPRDVEAAARSLGATPLQAFWRVTLPLTQEGLVVGGTLVFTGCVTAYVTPALLGGPQVLMLETLLYQKVNVEGDLGAANVIAVILIVLTLAMSVLLKRLAHRRSPRRP